MNKDRFGFLFWLGWMTWFAASFLGSAAVWTFFLTWLFGSLEGEELTVTWSVAVFASWFMFLIPFMRKKEQIWKRINGDQERSLRLWFWGMGTFLSTAIVSSIFWSWKYRLDFGASGLYGPWSKAVFGTWLLMLLPFLAFMYRQADRIFKDAVMRQSQAGPRFRTVLIEKSKRLLTPDLCRKIRQTKPVMPEGHVVACILKDGRKIPNVFVVRGQEILGLYDRLTMDFSGEDIHDIEGGASKELPAYEEEKWLRLDGRI